MTSDCCKICNGSGVIVYIEDGNLFAKNCECTERAIAANKLRFANIPESFKAVKVADFQTGFYQTEEGKGLARSARQNVAKYIERFEVYKEQGKGLYFYSHAKGSGKTMLAIALGNALMNVHKENVKFATAIDILEEIKATFGEAGKKRSDLIHSLKSVSVLIVDDIGVEKPTGWVNDMLFQILNDRANNKLVTIFTSNTHISNLQHDERLKSRINRMVMCVQMPEESIRDRLAEKENAQMMQELIGD